MTTLKKINTPKKILSQYSITPIGGVNEIGSNMTLIELSQINIIIDIGILFPHEDFFNIQHLIPDFYHLNSNKETHLVITHGHEDHIGAICYLLRFNPKIIIWAPPFAKGLIQAKFEKQAITKDINLYTSKDIIEIGLLKITPIQVNHSIPDTFGLLIQNSDLSVSTFFVSDFKVDHKTSYEPYFDFKTLCQKSKTSKIRLLLADSTNILNTKRTLSEEDLRSDLYKLISKAPSRVFITFFASNIHRFKTIITIAKKTKKKIILLGAAHRSYLRIARELNYIEGIDDVYDKDQTLDDFTEEDLQSKHFIFVTTGGQGEHRGALRRLARGEQKKITLTPSDTIIFSSSVIPGNEKKVFALFNLFANQNLHLHTSRDFKIHASGHASQIDIDQLIQEFRPTHYVPIHGESFLLERHCHYVKSKHPKLPSFSIRNFDKICLTKTSVRIEPSLNNIIKPPLMFDQSGNLLERETISERRKLAANGTIFISADFNYNLKIKFSGIPKAISQSQKIIDKVKYQIKKELSSLIQKNGINKIEELEEELRIFARREFSNYLNYRAIVLVQILS